MANLEHAFKDAAGRAAEELDSICLDEIHKLGISKTHTDLLGSHTVVTYPPLDALEPINGNKVFSDIDFQPLVDAYVHIPFCEYPCEFCPYTTLNVNGPSAGKMPEYFAALQQEIKTWAKKLREQKAEVRSLYVGGGTPFILPAESLETILSFIRSELPFIENPEICVETSPKATIQPDAKEKLAMLKKLGVSRMSIGIQTFDYESLRDMARTFRGHSADDEENAARTLLESGISNINIDMIQDLPLKSKDYLERLKNDLFKISQLRPQHITWYNMRLRPETAYAERDIKMVTEEESLHTRLTIWNFIEAIGYKVLEGDRFVLDEAFEDNFRKTRGSVDTDLLGMGVSAYSHVSISSSTDKASSVFFQNPRVIGNTVRADSKAATDAYIAAMKQNGHAISAAFLIGPDERLAGRLALGLKRGVSHEQVHELYKWHPECGGYFSFVLNSSEDLLQAGLLQISDGMIEFTRKGRLFENEICARFYTPTVRYQAKKRRGILDKETEEAFYGYSTRVLMDEIGAEQKPL